MKTIGLFLFTLLLFACGNENTQQAKGQIVEQDSLALLNFGDSITSFAQNVLLQNVAQAMQNGDTDAAISFCNIAAMPLTDSLSHLHNVTIQRLTDKNRNPKNAIQSPMDSVAWEKIKTGKTHFVQSANDGEQYYYKPIVMAMPTCIKCHGNESDIALSTSKLLQQKYPADKAIGYVLGDMRAMWKIKIKEQIK